MKTYFVPFADAAIGATEAVTGTENLDRYAVNQLRAALDDRYKARPFGSYKVERTPRETVQTFLFATKTGTKARNTAVVR